MTSSNGSLTTDWLKPVRPRYLWEEAFDRLRAAIVAGAIPPGAPIVIHELAQHLDLSAMPAREAVKRLVADGLIEELPRRAYRVAPLSDDDARELIDVAEAMTSLACRRRAASRPSDDLVAAAQRLDETLAGGDAASIGESFADFHRQLCATAGNRELDRIATTVLPKVQRLITLRLADTLREASADDAVPLTTVVEEGRAENVERALGTLWRRLHRRCTRREETTCSRSTRRSGARTRTASGSG